MNKFGRKIYFDKSTGNVLIDTGELAGDVRETTTEEDFATYTVLSGRKPETVGCLRIPFGQDREKFAQYAYHVDPVTEKIVWDLTPIQREEEERKETMEEQIAALQSENARLREQLASTNADLQGLVEYIDEALSGGVA
ncbi:hypothetical protein G3578_10150 [Brevibacillus sp. SYP-B805]|uniref:hypothetical protein n=1 Tax=Brevibacillus sp. SYP-B805 TaxID=1578199 RepID=UPI0013EC70CB|nr:hypothetical protein [Brevibacillus sp. SYP-B805]NGQ95514.1 hypothetical protein [Brevibacillus sp. SYP-B805]